MFGTHTFIMLTIQITKRTDGAGLLRCIRADGSITWQRQRERHAGFFALHDLTHFAVESALGFRQGFYGLITQGWEIDDTTGKGARGPLPDEAVEVEHIVGWFDSERASLTTGTAEEFNQYAAMQAASSGRRTPRQLSEDDLARVRELRGKLFSRWFALEPGATLDLRYEL
jgi:hypothetical protein